MFAHIMLSRGIRYDAKFLKFSGFEIDLNLFCHFCQSFLLHKHVLTHLSLAFCKRGIGKQIRSDATERGVLSWSQLFAVRNLYKT